MRSKCQKIYQYELCIVIVKLCIQDVSSSNDEMTTYQCNTHSSQVDAFQLRAYLS